MKLKIFFILFLALTASALQAQTQTNALANETRAIAQQVRTKLQSHQLAKTEVTEAELAPELKAFDVLLAKHPGEKTDDVALVLFMKAMLYFEVLHDEAKGVAIVQQVKKDFPETKYGKGADRILAQVAQQAEAKKNASTLVAGAMFPDFNEKDLNGKTLSIASRKGKVVLVDFWATWCGPCRAELPNVIATYQKFHAQGFEIIGVSLDSERPALDAFLRQQNEMTWPQFYDGNGWSNKLAVKYGVQSIPFTVLIGPDGKIIGTDLRGEDLGAAVAKALAKK